MAFHPENCSAIGVTRARKPNSSSYILKGNTLNMEDSSWYLGVELQSNMFLNRHMDQAVKKANSTLGILRRSLRIYSKANHRVLLNSLEPYIKEYVSKVEMVQRRAARHITNMYRNTSSVTSMLDHLEWESLEA